TARQRRPDAHRRGRPAARGRRPVHRGQGRHRRVLRRRRAGLRRRGRPRARLPRARARPDPRAPDRRRVTPAGHDVPRLLRHLFRRQAGRLIALLTRIFGRDPLDLAEDVAQEALIAALEVWPYHGVPRNPTAWLAQVAKNRALNQLKRKRLWAEKAVEVAAAL